MSQSHGLILLALLALCIVGALMLVASAPTRTPRWYALVALTLLGAALPYGIHAQQTYESLVNISPTNRLPPMGLEPGLDRFVVATWVTIAVLVLVGLILSRWKPAAAPVIPFAMAALYFGALLPLAVRARPAGTSPSAMSHSWLYLATAIGAAILLNASRSRRRPADA